LYKSPVKIKKNKKKKQKKKQRKMAEKGKKETEKKGKKSSFTLFSHFILHFCPFLVTNLLFSRFGFTFSSP